MKETVAVWNIVNDINVDRDYCWQVMVNTYICYVTSFLLDVGDNDEYKIKSFFLFFLFLNNCSMPQVRLYEYMFIV